MDLKYIVLAIIALCIILYSRSRQRYRDPGAEADVRNLEEFGTPVKSLFTSTEIFTLHHRIEVTDENEQVVYRAETEFPSIHDKTDVFDAEGKHIAHIERKLISLREIHYVEMDKGRNFTLSNELLHIIKDVTNIEGLGWTLKGNIIQLNFTIKDENGELIAVVSQKMFSMHDKYVVDIFKPEFEEEVVAILITLQHMIRDRDAAQSTTSISSGSSS